MRNRETVERSDRAVCWALLVSTEKISNHRTKQHTDRWIKFVDDAKTNDGTDDNNYYSSFQPAIKYCV